MNDALIQSLYSSSWDSMLELRLYTSLALFVALALALAYGIYMLMFRKKPQPYAISAVIGIGCLMMGKLFTLVMVWSEHSIVTSYNTSLLGRLGGLAFIFLAIMQSQTGNTRVSKKRDTRLMIISGVVTLILVVPSLVLLYGYERFIGDKIIYTIEILLHGGLMFLNFYGAFSSSSNNAASKGMKPFNVALLINSASTVLLMVFWSTIFAHPALVLPIIIATAVQFASVLVMTPLLGRGLECSR